MDSARGQRASASSGTKRRRAPAKPKATLAAGLLDKLPAQPGQGGPHLAVHSLKDCLQAQPLPLPSTDAPRALPPARRPAPGPWLQRCIERWGLTAPFDPEVTEAQWEGYFKERAALEWHTNAFVARGQAAAAGRAGDIDGEAAGAPAAGAAALQPEEAEGQGEGQQQEAAWPFDWEQPAGLRSFCREHYGRCVTAAAGALCCRQK